MVTVVLSLGLLVVGLAAYFMPGPEVAALIRDLGLPGDIQGIVLDFLEHDLFAFAALAAAPLLLIVGSLLRDV